MAMIAIGSRVWTAGGTRPYQPSPSDPQWRPLRVFSIDPAQPRRLEAVTTLDVPFEPLGPGPSGALFVVDPHDAVHGIDYAAVDLETPAALMHGGVEPSEGDPKFHQQMVYAVASSVYRTFREALGRAPGFAVPPGADGRTRLRLRPHGAAGLDAWYDRARGEIVFGYAPTPAGYVFTCLSHDVVVHEVTHALVDGLRSHLSVATSPDVPAFHEAMADLVALFHRLTCEGLLQAVMRESGTGLRECTVLTTIARQVAEAYRRPGLRAAIEPAGIAPRQYDPSLDAHALGGVLVAAVFDAFAAIHARKSARHIRLATSGTGLLPPGTPPHDLVAALATEASDLARQFLKMCIRAIDYCPPVDVQFGEFLRAVITADRDLVPDDRWSYREAWIQAFKRRGIRAPGVATMSEDALVWSPPDIGLPRLAVVHDDGAGQQACEVAALAAAPAHRAAFGLLEAAPGDPDVRPGTVVVESVRSLRRAGPDGHVLTDLVAEVVQHARLAGAPDDVLLGGSTVIAGADGRVRFVIRKSLAAAVRRRCGKQSRCHEGTMPRRPHA
jgi:hypothetical protein